MPSPEMPTVICDAGSWVGEFLAAIVGAVVGGVIVFLTQQVALREVRTQRKEDSDAQQRALGHALVIKMVQIYSHLHLLNSSVSQQIATARASGFQGRNWQIIVPIANLPERVRFSTDEMALLLSLKENDLFNDLAAMDERHNGTIDAFGAYREMRQQLGAMVPSDMRGNVGTAQLTEEQMRRVGPKVTEIDTLFEGLIPQCQKQEREAWDALRRLTAAFSSKIGLTLKIEQKENEKAQAGAVNSREPR